MASIIRSAQSSTASFFDLFGVTANAATDLVRTGAQGISMLSAKTQLMHDRVQTNLTLQRSVMITEEIAAATKRHVEIIDEAQEWASASPERFALYNDTATKMEALLAAKP